MIPAALLAKLRQNGEQSARKEFDHFPVVKLFTPDAGATWLLSELAADGDTAFGLCDLGLGCPELGYVSLTELRRLRGRLGLPSIETAISRRQSRFPNTSPRLASKAGSSPRRRSTCCRVPICRFPCMMRLRGAWV